VAGANRTGWHLRNVRLGRDFQARTADIRFVEEGELSVGSGSPLRIVPAIEVGNIFKLGTRYSDAFGATYLDEGGVERPIWMGSYGVGPARTLAAAVEQGHDEHGIVWPQAVAPYDVWITPIGEEALAAADRLDEELRGRGLQALVDDRALSPGVRFADADLIGVPLRVTIGKRLATEGTVEIKRRATGESVAVPLADAVTQLVALAG
jgi:prolyl-tRNA synthetase